VDLSLKLTGLVQRSVTAWRYIHQMNRVNSIMADKAAFIVANTINYNDISMSTLYDTTNFTSVYKKNLFTLNNTTVMNVNVN